MNIPQNNEATCLVKCGGRNGVWMSDFAKGVAPI